MVSIQFQTPHQTAKMAEVGRNPTNRICSDSRFTHSVVNSQGKAEQKYVVSIEFSTKPHHVKMGGAWPEAWPEWSEQNPERLVEAGVPLDGNLVVCDSCKEVRRHVHKPHPNGGDSEDELMMAITRNAL